MGGGTGITVTNVYFKQTTQHSQDFHFTHCNYSNFKGTELSWKNVSIIFHEQRVNIKELLEYTDEQCLEFIFTNIPGSKILEIIDAIQLQSKHEAIRQFKQTLREMLFE